MWKLLAMVLAQSVVEPTPPPLVPGPSDGARAPPLSADGPSGEFVVPAPPPPRSVKKKPKLPDATVAIYFAPTSLFALTLWLELDLHLTGGWSVFVNGGGGPLGVLGGDVGTRFYVEGHAFEGFYLDARASVFSLPAGGLVILGPGLQVGHAWRAGRVTVSLALGFTTWFSVSPMRAGATFMGTVPREGQVIALPGLAVPPEGGSSPAGAAVLLRPLVLSRGGVPAPQGC